MDKVYIEDDQGEFASRDISDYENIEDAAICLVNELRDWFEPETNDIYDVESCEEAQRQCDKIVNNIRNGINDFEEGNWGSCYGFKFFAE